MEDSYKVTGMVVLKTQSVSEKIKTAWLLIATAWMGIWNGCVVIETKTPTDQGYRPVDDTTQHS